MEFENGVYLGGGDPSFVQLWVLRSVVPCNDLTPDGTSKMKKAIRSSLIPHGGAVTVPPTQSKPDCHHYSNKVP
ncbi:hypothetical protein GmHk_06G015176 [Glycine max]|nr:hypothetical protein GmHk_06G015176 [Glycine max]